MRGAVTSAFRAGGGCASVRRVRIVSALFATLVAAAAAPSEPGDAALAFLEKVRARQVNLEPGTDTAISPETSRTKRREIARRLDRMAADIGGEPLELGPVKRDGDLAAVLVRRSPGFDITNLHVIPVGLVLRDGRWLPAPLPSSFENSGLLHRPGFRERLQTLESWMMSSRARDILALKEEAAARIRQRIERGISLEKLRAMDSHQAALCFLDACRKRDLAMAIGLLGGLSESPPADLRNRIRVCEEALRSPAPALRPWQLLCSNEALRALVHHEEDGNSALVSIACIDPRQKMRKSSQPRVEFVHIEFLRGRDGLWRADPGETFWAPADSQGPGDDAVLDGDLLDKFPGQLVANHPARPQSTSAGAEAALLAAARRSSPAALLETTRISDNPGIARIALGRLVNLWRATHHPAPGSHIMPLARTERDGVAVSYLQLLSPREPMKFRPVTLVFRRQDDGWLWEPDSLDVGEEFRDWLDQQQDHWPAAWSGKLLAGSQLMERFAAPHAPGEAESRAVVETWFRLLRDGDLEAALGSCARLLGEPGQEDMLRRAVMDMHDVSNREAAPVIVSVRSGKRLTLVEAGLQRDGESFLPLYPVIATPAGPRILLESDLYANGSRTRQFLNRASIDRFRRFHPDLADDLDELLRRSSTKSGDAD